MGATNGLKLFIGTSDALYIAEPGDAGYTSRKVGLEGLGDFRAAPVVDCRDASTVYAGTNKAGMFRSRDGGETWQEINNGLLHKTVWSIIQHQPTGDLYVGASPASVFVSKDQGDSWVEHDSIELMPETKDWTGPVPPHVSRMKGIAISTGATPVIYGAIEEGWAVRSLDNGKTWEQIAQDLGPISHDGHSVAVVSNEPDSVVVSTGKGMFRSTDKGEHFEPVSQGLEGRAYTSTSLMTHPDRPGYMLSGVTAVGPGRWRRPEGGDSGFARSEDGGKTWQVSTAGLPTPCVGVPRGISIAPDDASLAFAGLTDGTIWMTSNSGEFFEQVLDGLPPVMSVTVA